MARAADSRHYRAGCRRARPGRSRPAPIPGPLLPQFQHHWHGRSIGGPSRPILSWMSAAIGVLQGMRPGGRLRSSIRPAAQIPLASWRNRLEVPDAGRGTSRARSLARTSARRPGRRTPNQPEPSEPQLAGPAAEAPTSPNLSSPARRIRPRRRRAPQRADSDVRERRSGAANDGRSRLAGERRKAPA